MHFEAESNGQKFEVIVNETRLDWKVSLKPEEGQWTHYNIPKSDYQLLDQSISFIFNKRSYLVDVVGEDTHYTVYTRGSHRNIKIYNDEALLHESLKTGKSLGGDDSLVSGMPGKIVKVYVKPGEEIKEGEPLLIMEAMKMENEMLAPSDVKIKSVHVQEGQNVESGVTLITYE